MIIGEKKNMIYEKYNREKQIKFKNIKYKTRKYKRAYITMRINFNLREI